MLEYGTGRRLRGLCLRCARCQGWTERSLPLPDDEPHAPTSGGSGREAPGDVSSVDPGTGARGGRGCGSCGCTETAHEDVTAKYAAYVSRGIPLSALRWSQVEFDLWRDTDGLFEPRGSAPPDRRRAAGVDMVSVICPTTGSRRCFHGLLYACWRSQTYEPKQLVVVDTCEDEPSELLVRKMAEDPRVVYRHFHVPERSWSIGLKRNLACQLASGDLIAHFDDDDMYGQDYLKTMVGCMRSPESVFGEARQCEDRRLLWRMYASMGLVPGVWEPEQALASLRAQAGLGRFGAACAKLARWHTYVLQTRSFKLFDACEYDERELHGWGFSFVYLRSAWLSCPFAHMGLGEDYDFVRRLRQLGQPVLLVPDRAGICVHTCHLDNTAGGVDAEGPGKRSSGTQPCCPVAGLLHILEAYAKPILDSQLSHRRSGRGTLRQEA
mmetsp:Transcript_108702/g.335767  ORF Transcript_108702/g.335767 Transcript_108702/m.335767 type:complete len:438 (-) Transcript_108702:6-1319(-)